MKELLLVLHENNKEALGTVRHLKQLQVAPAGAWLWLRYPAGAEGAAAAKLQQLPAHTTYTLAEGNKLFPAGGRTPVALLQEMNWTPIQQFLPLELPVAALPGKQEQQCAIQLVASNRQEEGCALLTSLQYWCSYAESAPEIRLKQLRFAISERERVLIMGTPLPPIPGQEYWLKEGSLLPAGVDFQFPVIASLIAARLNPKQDQLLLFDADGSWVSIAEEALVPATRSGIRLSREGLSHE